MTTYPAVGPNNRWRPFSSQRWSKSHAQGVTNKKPYPARCSRRKWSLPTATMRMFKIAAIANGKMTTNRFVQLMLVFYLAQSFPSLLRLADKQACALAPSIFVFRYC
jgi:hypothetical protein